jgi:outer membrane biosynthesis protein TonB
MRIYNNTDTQIEFDLSPVRKIVIPAHAFSGNFLPTTAVLDKLVRAFTPDQLAFMVANAAEINLCSTTQCTTTGNFVCGSMEEIAERFGIANTKDVKTKEKTATPAKEETPVEGAVLKEKVIEPAPEVESEVKSDDVVTNVDTPVPEPEPAKKSKKAKKKD